MISSKGCNIELEIFDYNFTKQTVSTIEKGEWYRINELNGGSDSWDGNKKMRCGSVTNDRKYIRLCDDCARKEGLKW